MTYTVQQNKHQQLSASNVHNTMLYTKQQLDDNNNKRHITLDELEQHSGGRTSSWTVVYGKVYDITQFLSQHPGGSIIKYAAGRDCTSLYESYHSTQSLNKCNAHVNNLTYIGEFAETSCNCNKQHNTAIKPTESHDTCMHTPDDEFFVTVRNRVDNYLFEHYGRSVRHAKQWQCQLEAIVTLLLYIVATYYVSFKGSYASCVILGLLTGRMGFVMHSGNHCSVSNIPIVNRLVGTFMDVVGSSHYIWGFEHQVAHHMSPNTYKKDNDCEIGNPMFRFHPLIPADTDDQNAKLSSFDRFLRRNQYWLIPCLMSIGFFKWFANDIEFFMKQRAGNVKVPTTPKLWCYMLACKVVWSILHVVIPYYYFGLSYTLISVFIFMAIGAEYLENTFIVNHIQEMCQETMIDDDNNIIHNNNDKQHNNNNNGNNNNNKNRNKKPLHWAVQQVETTSNWCSESIFWNFMSGGLNHQIEHHLFPTMSTCLYPYISHIVQQTCQEFNLPYHNYKSFRSAYSDMINYLKKLGQAQHKLDKLYNSKNL